MIYKTITFILFGVLMAGFVLALSAGDITISPTVLKFTQNGQEQTLTIDNFNSGADIDVDFSVIPSITKGTVSANFELSSQSISLDAGDSSNVNVKLNGNPLDFPFGQYSTLFNVTATNQSDNKDTINLGTVSLQFDRGFCNVGPAGGNLEINDIDIDNIDGDDDEWELLDVIEITVEVENTNKDDDIDEVMVELALFDSSGKDFTGDLEFENTDEEEIDLGDINDDDKEEGTFVFRIPADFDDGNYRLAIKAYSDDLGQDVECVDTSNKFEDSDFFTTINVDRVSDEDEFIVVDDILFDAQATCGETVSGTFSVFNVGEDDEDQVLIELRGSALDINEDFLIRENFDKGDDPRFDFNFVVPQALTDGTYNLEFRTFYDFRNGVYRERSGETFTAPLRVLGCKAGVVPGSQSSTQEGILISPSLASNAMAGERLIVNTAITNTGTAQDNFIVSATGFQSWASLDSISLTSLSLNAGETKTTTISLDVNDGVSGSQSFIIQAASAEGVSLQEVEVFIEEGEESGSGAGITGSAIFNSDNARLIWLIAAINIILIILIIVVAVRLSRR